MLNEMKVFLRDKQLESVEFVGPVPQAKLPPLMSSSHVLVLPSVEDGFGLVLGQAMACGCPVICSSNTGGEELVSGDNGGFVVPVRNPKALTEKLEVLCQDRALQRRMGEAALARVKAMGGWDDYGRNYAELCSALLQESNSHFSKSLA
jgi:glycosyltransferase involved in cell wall biosynthesis